MLLYVYAFDLLSMSTSHTAVVPKRSFSMRELRIFRSCSASALPAGTGAPAAAVFGAEGWPEFFVSVYSTPPTATAAITTNTPTTILLELACFCSCAASNIFPPSPPNCAFAHRNSRVFEKADDALHLSPANEGASLDLETKGRKSLAYPYSASRKPLQALAFSRALPPGYNKIAASSPNLRAPLRVLAAFPRTLIGSREEAEDSLSFSFLPLLPTPQLLSSRSKLNTSASLCPVPKWESS